MKSNETTFQTQHNTYVGKKCYSANGGCTGLLNTTDLWPMTVALAVSFLTLNKALLLTTVGSCGLSSERGLLRGEVY